MLSPELPFPQYTPYSFKHNNLQSNTKQNKFSSQNRQLTCLCFRACHGSKPPTTASLPVVFQIIYRKHLICSHLGLMIKQNWQIGPLKQEAILIYCPRILSGIQYYCQLIWNFPTPLIASAYEFLFSNTIFISSFLLLQGNIKSNEDFFFHFLNFHLSSSIVSSTIFSLFFEPPGFILF